MIKHLKKNILIYIAPILIAAGFGLTELSFTVTGDATSNDPVKIAGWVCFVGGIIWIPFSIVIRLFLKKK